MLYALLVQGSAGISQLLGLREGCICSSGIAQGIESHALGVPGFGKVRIKPYGLIISLEGLIVPALIRESKAFVVQGCGIVGIQPK